MEFGETNVASPDHLWARRSGRRLRRRLAGESAFGRRHSARDDLIRPRTDRTHEPH
jgi:hypothetical protein